MRVAQRRLIVKRITFARVAFMSGASADIAPNHKSQRGVIIGQGLETVGAGPIRSCYADLTCVADTRGQLRQLHVVNPTPIGQSRYLMGLSGNLPCIRRGEVDTGMGGFIEPIAELSLEVSGIERLETHRHCRARIVLPG